MRRIALRGRDGRVRAYTLVDDALYGWLNQWRWHLHTKGYVARTERLPDGRTATHKMHRQIMGYPETQVDHKNRNKLDNRIENLRTATVCEQQQNRGVQRNSPVGVRGVTWQRPRLRANGWQRGGWRARAQVNGRSHYLGCFATVREAEKAVMAFRAKHMPLAP